MSAYFTRQKALCRFCGAVCQAALVCRPGPICAACAAVAVDQVMDKLAGALLAEEERNAA